MLFEAGTQFVKRGSHALAFGIARVEHCAQLDAPLILLDEQHEYGIAGCIRDGREIVQAIIEHAYYRSRQRSIGLHERRAFNADRAQIGRRFVEHKLQSLAIEFGVAFLGKNERTLALAVGDEQLDLNKISRRRAMESGSLESGRLSSSIWMRRVLLSRDFSISTNSSRSLRNRHISCCTSASRSSTALLRRKRSCVAASASRRSSIAATSSAKTARPPLTG